MRYTEPGTIQETVSEAYQAAGGVTAVARFLGLSLSTASYGTENSEHRPGGIGVNYLERLGMWKPECAEPVAVHFADLAGGVFQPMPTGGALSSDLSTLMKEFSDVVAHHAAAHSEASENPNDFTPREARAAKKELDELVRAALVYGAALAARVEGEG
jgi:hypothetical protein